MDLAKSLRENGFSGGDASLVLVNKLVRVMSSSASIGGIQSPAVGRKGEPKRSAVPPPPPSLPLRTFIDSPSIPNYWSAG
jgi:hypothetical protein